MPALADFLIVVEAPDWPGGFDARKAPVLPLVCNPSLHHALFAYIHANDGNPFAIADADAFWVWFDRWIEAECQLHSWAEIRDLYLKLISAAPVVSAEAVNCLKAFDRIVE